MEIIIFVVASIIGLISIVLGVVTLICIKGVTWSIIEGTRRVPENVKWRYRVRHYRIAMNRLVAMSILLPIVVLCVFIATQILLSFGLMDQIILGLVILVSGVSIVLFVAYAIPKILTGIFYKNFASKEGEDAKTCSNQTKKTVS